MHWTLRLQSCRLFKVGSWVLVRCMSGYGMDERLVPENEICEEAIFVHKRT